MFFFISVRDDFKKSFKIGIGFVRVYIWMYSLRPGFSFSYRSGLGTPMSGFTLLCRLPCCALISFITFISSKYFLRLCTTEI